MATIAEILNDQAPIALGSAMALAAGAVTVTIWIVRAISQIRDSVQGLRSEVELLRQSVASKLDGTVKSPDFFRWILRLKELNPSLTLPEETP